MVITITMKNVIKRGEIYCFRKGVPQDCRDAVGRREIMESLQTDDAAKAAVTADEMTAAWRAKFKKLRLEAKGTPVNGVEGVTVMVPLGIRKGIICTNIYGQSVPQYP